MSLLSKLLGKTGAELVKKAAEAVAHEALNGSNAKDKETTTQSHAPQTGSHIEPTYKEPSPSGFSWGEEMPAEENQFNYNGPYDKYFEEIFRTEFAAYRLERQDVSSGKRQIFTFWDGGRKALVVELMAQSSDSQKLRRDCRAAGIPYLRYYYNHDGWWNTRAYVVQRTRKALEG